MPSRMLVAATAATSPPAAPAAASASRMQAVISRQLVSTSKSWPPGTPGGSWWVHSRCPTPACSPVSVNSTARQLPVPASMASRYGPLIRGRASLCDLGLQGRGVHHVGGYPPGQQLGHRGDRPLRAPGQGLGGGPADMRGDEDVR